jgi:iron complex outermembrane receptor protein
MFRSSLLCGASGVAAALTLGLCANAASAADAPTPVSEITVTGSYIAGTPETAALPVTVVTQDTLAKQGSPSIVELTKMLPESSGIIGESNQFTAGRGQGGEGTSTINLRGLGPERTLVLMNGHRLPLITGLTVDTQSLPFSAIGRIEVLKDGAAATYGSDAIGGVVNFITKKNFSGLDVAGDYRYVPGSDGDYDISATWGHAADRWNVMVSGGFQHRSALPVTERDWAVKTYGANPEGGWSGASSPTEFLPVGPFGAGGNLIFLAGTRPDVNCTKLGGVLTNANANAAPLLPFSNCRMQYTPWDNLEEKQTSYQFYGEFNASLGDTTRLHLEGFYSYNETPHTNTTPSYATSRPIPATVLPPNIATGGTNGFIVGTSPPALNFFFTPISNPGFQAYMAANPGQFPLGTSGAFITIGTFRPFFAGGNPAFGYQESYGVRHHTAWRFSGDLKGELGHGIGWDTSLTYGEYDYFSAGFDSLTDRLELALRGLGGPNCNYQTGTPGQGGCMWYNPFSNAIPSAPKAGVANNPAFNAAVANDPNLAAWIFPYQFGTQIYRNLEWDVVLDGKLPISLPGGKIGWAAGGQLRYNHYERHDSQFASAVASPCSDTPLTGLTTCTPQSGPNVFLGVANPTNVSQNIYAAFGEITLPLFDRLNLDVAGRYEDYGKNGGSTFNPQVRGKWQALDWFALRGSIGTTFRAPPQGFLIPDPATTLQNVLGTFRPVDTIGNPALQPEKARVFSVGAIVEHGGFRATVDYWNYQFKNIITSEPLTQVVAALFPTGTGTGNCATLDPKFIADHFEFSGPCNAANVTKVKLQRINGPQVDTDGIDFNGTYSFKEVWEGVLTLGVQATYVHKYTVGGFTVGGVPIAGFEAVGFFNSGTVAYPLPKWKANSYIEFSKGPVNVRWTARYTDSYVDQRTALFGWNAAYQQGTLQACGNPSATTAATVVSRTCGYVTKGQTIKAIVLNDLAVRWQMPWNMTGTATINNVFDLNPPFARTELNYDPLTGDPLGRTFKIGLQKRF